MSYAYVLVFHYIKWSGRMQNGLLCIVKHLWNVVQCFSRAFDAAFNFGKIFHDRQHMLEMYYRLFIAVYTTCSEYVRLLLNNQPDRPCCLQERLVCVDQMICCFLWTEASVTLYAQVNCHPPPSIRCTQHALCWSLLVAFRQTARKLNFKFFF